MTEDRTFRKRLWRWIRWTIVVVPIVLLISHAIWGYAEGAGVRRRVEALKAAGEPILPADFTPLADGAGNGGDDILAAGDAVTAYREANPAYDDLDAALPLRTEERLVIETALADLSAPLAQLERARGTPRQDWKLDLSSPVLVKFLLPSVLNGQRSLCVLLGAAALLDHEKGDDASALGRIDRILFVARFNDRHPSLVGHLVSIGCTALACETVYQIAPDLRVGSGAGEVSPPEVRRIIDLLLDEEHPRAGLRLAMRGERMVQLDTIESILNGKMDLQRTTRPPDTSGKSAGADSVTRYFVGPVFRHNACVMLDHMTPLIPLADEPDLPAARANSPPARQRGSWLNLLADILLPSLDRAFEAHHRANSDRRMAATALAIRCYAVDHGGKRPARLDELVPQYLPAVPRDSLLADRPIGYIADGDRPRLYSAGANYVDDGGGEAFIHPYADGRSPERGDGWKTLDRCVYLDRQPRPTPEVELP
jgi:hypothetical protein